MKKMKFTWGHGIILALLCFMGFILTLIFLASDTGELVTEDYYEHSLTYQKEVIDAEQNYNELKQKPEIRLQANGILIDFPKELSVEKGSVYLMRGAHKADDVAMPLELSNHAMLIPAVKLEPGEYDLELEWHGENKKYLIKKLIQWNMP